MGLHHRRLCAGKCTGMQTLGSALDEQKGFAQGFDFLRILLATSIIGWHTAKLSGHVEMARASVFWFSEYMLVPMFFALSGFLVAGSSMRLSTKNFLVEPRRAHLAGTRCRHRFRSASDRPAGDDTACEASISLTQLSLAYFLNITGWMQYFLPGVFENNPLPEVNGALWTVPFEIGCYVMLAGLMASGAIKRPEIGTAVHLRRSDGRDSPQGRDVASGKRSCIVCLKSWRWTCSFSPRISALALFSDRNRPLSAAAPRAFLQIGCDWLGVCGDRL